MKKILVAYFSHAGMNYSRGEIVNLKVGNTKVVADKIANLVGGKSFEIKAKTAYPFQYRECTDVAKQELRQNARPALENDIDVSEFDAVVVAYPNWWGTMPMPVWTFLESHDFSGKTIYPVCTNEGSGMGDSERDLKKLCPTAKIEKGLAIFGSSVNSCDAQLEKWSKNLL